MNDISEKCGGLRVRCDENLQVVVVVLWRHDAASSPHHIPHPSSRYNVDSSFTVSTSFPLHSSPLRSLSSTNQFGGGPVLPYNKFSPSTGSGFPCPSYWLHLPTNVLQHPNSTFVCTLLYLNFTGHSDTI